ncbi:MAG TPA: MotA/TolQ/ExbB proton channel family protein [Candidatus Acidoferrum sp.]|jgi:biopolymer transport protein ExbB|nr:MotA/TolQ/ExbB proton channel family protein [Candidatus Acidoferrum sp.]
MLANIVFQFFLKGGPVMWPILACALAAVAVVGERAFWWWRESLKRDVRRREQVLAALENSDAEAAQGLAQGSGDPVIRMIHHSLNHEHTSIPVALQMAAGIELERAGRFLNVMDTLVTLAPLLGLLGTVTGLMRAFLKVGSAELSVVAVTGGIGEALIATACGLLIAIVSLVPLNYFSGKLARLQFELETAASNVEVLANAGKLHATTAPALLHPKN